MTICAAICLFFLATVPALVLTDVHYNSEAIERLLHRRNNVVLEQAGLASPGTKLTLVDRDDDDSPYMASYQWTIEAYEKRQEKRLDSSVFRAAATLWQLILYPHGDEGHRGHISLYIGATLAPHWGPNEAVFSSWRFTVMNTRGKRPHIVQEAQHNFTRFSTNWGFNKLVLRSSLLDLGEGWVDELGDLQLRVDVRTVVPYWVDYMGIERQQYDTVRSSVTLWSEMRDLGVRDLMVSYSITEDGNSQVGYSLRGNSYNSPDELRAALAAQSDALRQYFGLAAPPAPATGGSPAVSRHAEPAAAAPRPGSAGSGNAAAAGRDTVFVGTGDCGGGTDPSGTDPGPGAFLFSGLVAGGDSGDGAPGLGFYQLGDGGGEDDGASGGLLAALASRLSVLGGYVTTPVVVGGAVYFLVMLGLQLDRAVRGLAAWFGWGGRAQDATGSSSAGGAKGKHGAGCARSGGKQRQAKAKPRAVAVHAGRAPEPQPSPHPGGPHQPHPQHPHHQHTGTATPSPSHSANTRSAPLQPHEPQLPRPQLASAGEHCSAGKPHRSPSVTEGGSGQGGTDVAGQLPGPSGAAGAGVGAGARGSGGTDGLKATGGAACRSGGSRGSSGGLSDARSLPRGSYPSSVNRADAGTGSSPGSSGSSFSGPSAQQTSRKPPPTSQGAADTTGAAAATATALPGAASASLAALPAQGGKKARNAAGSAPAAAPAAPRPTGTAATAVACISSAATAASSVAPHKSPHARSGATSLCSPPASGAAKHSPSLPTTVAVPTTAPCPPQAPAHSSTLSCSAPRLLNAPPCAAATGSLRPATATAAAASGTSSTGANLGTPRDSFGPVHGLPGSATAASPHAPDSQLHLNPLWTASPSTAPAALAALDPCITGMEAAPPDPFRAWTLDFSPLHPQARSSGPSTDSAGQLVHSSHWLQSDVPQQQRQQPWPGPMLDPQLAAQYGPAGVWLRGPVAGEGGRELGGRASAPPPLRSGELHPGFPPAAQLRAGGSCGGAAAAPVTAAAAADPPGYGPPGFGPGPGTGHGLGLLGGLGLPRSSKSAGGADCGRDGGSSGPAGAPWLAGGAQGLGDGDDEEQADSFIPASVAYSVLDGVVAPEGRPGAQPPATGSAAAGASGATPAAGAAVVAMSVDGSLAVGRYCSSGSSGTNSSVPSVCESGGVSYCGGPSASASSFVSAGCSSSGGSMLVAGGASTSGASSSSGSAGVGGKEPGTTAAVAAAEDQLLKILQQLKVSTGPQRGSNGAAATAAAAAPPPPPVAARGAVPRTEASISPHPGGAAFASASATPRSAGALPASRGGAEPSSTVAAPGGSRFKGKGRGKAGGAKSAASAVIPEGTTRHLATDRGDASNPAATSSLSTRAASCVHSATPAADTATAHHTIAPAPGSTTAAAAATTAAEARAAAPDTEGTATANAGYHSGLDGWRSQLTQLRLLTARRAAASLVSVARTLLAWAAVLVGEEDEDEDGVRAVTGVAAAVAAAGLGHGAVGPAQTEGASGAVAEGGAAGATAVGGIEGRAACPAGCGRAALDEACVGPPDGEAALQAGGARMNRGERRDDGLDGKHAPGPEAGEDAVARIGFYPSVCEPEAPPTVAAAAAAASVAAAAAASAATAAALETMARGAWGRESSGGGAVPSGLWASSPWAGSQLGLGPWAGREKPRCLVCLQHPSECAFLHPHHVCLGACFNCATGVAAEGSPGANTTRHSGAGGAGSGQPGGGPGPGLVCPFCHEAACGVVGVRAQVAG